MASSNPVADLLLANRALSVDRLVGRIVSTIPRYALLDPAELRATVDLLFDDMMDVLQRAESPGLLGHVAGVAQKRIAQGFSPGDYLRALLLSLPVVREVVRSLGPVDDAAYARGFHELEGALQSMITSTATVYMDSLSRQLEGKNRELNRLNQELKAHEAVLSREARETSKALASANEFNRRVIESLSSGLLVVGTDGKVTLYTTRLEEIIGLPAETVLGHDVVQALAPIKGLDPAALVDVVRAAGRLPLTRLRLNLASGRQRSVYVCAQRLFDAAGEPEGTVVVVDDVTERELLLDSFSRYVSRDLVQRLLARAEPLGLGGEKRVCTILFADLRGYTTLAETLSPEALHDLLNQYFRVMIESITSNSGFIDKFIGDNVMAIFSGTPRPEDHACSAVRAALRIKRGIAELSQQRKIAGQSPIDVGIGINTGEVLLGNVGSEERMDFTAIGDAVNVASRLQGIARSGEVFLGEPTAKLLGGGFPLEDRGPKEIRGRSAPVHVFELVVPKG